MITKPTTLILGAGASAPFGFPSGFELLRQVIDIADIGDASGNNLLSAYFQLEEMLLFQDALQKSGKTSVDAFLEHRPEFIKIGKMAIAIALIKCEDERMLFKRDGNSWYEYLFSLLNAPFKNFHENKLTVLTFNYDRSLEHFLFTALRNSSGKSEKECAEKLGTIKIIHLHGDLGALPHAQKNLSRAYNFGVTSETVSIAAESIRIIHEGISENPQFHEAHRILEESEVICFLGFGYHPLNMKRLGLDRPNRIDCFLGRSPQIIGTSFGLTAAECRQVNQFAQIELRPSRAQSQDCSKWDCLRFLREIGADYIR